MNGSALILPDRVKNFVKYQTELEQEVTVRMWFSRWSSSNNMVSNNTLDYLCSLDQALASVITSLKDLLSKQEEHLNEFSSTSAQL